MEQRPPRAQPMPPDRTGALSSEFGLELLPLRAPDPPESTEKWLPARRSRPQHLYTWQVVVEFKRVCRKAVDASLQSQSTLRCTHLPALRERERGLGLLPGTERSTLGLLVGQSMLAPISPCGHPPLRRSTRLLTRLLRRPCGPRGEATPLWCQGTQRLQQRSGACRRGAPPQR